MALENYRPIQFPEKTELDSTDVVLIDSATNGTNKYQLNRIAAQASAETAAAVAAEAQARQAADAAEVTARNAAISAAISDEVTARNAAIAANVDDTLTVSGKSADAKKTGDEIADLKSDLSDISTTVMPVNLLDLNDSDFAVGQYVNNSTGALFSSGSYNTSGYIPVEEGATYQFSTANTVRSMRFICAYDSNKAVLGSKGSGSSVTLFTVPTGVSFIRFSASKDYLTKNANAVAFYKDGTMSGFSPYYKPFLKIQNNVFIEQNKSLAIKYPTLSSGEMRILSSIDNKKNKIIEFIGYFSAAPSRVSVGHGATITYGSYCSITEDSIFVYDGTTLKTTLSHGLTLSGFLHVIIKQNATSGATIQITTATGQYKSDTVDWGASRGVFTASIDGTMTDCVLSISLTDLQNDIYLFGDSYIGTYNLERYPYYLINNGFTKFLADGYPGRNSASAMTSFLNTMQIGQPKYAVWALGMNDGDNADSINSDWKNYVEQFLAFCDANKITPILATIPNTPVIKNTYKNDYVKNSGRRFVDFAKAVGAEAEGATWYAGMLNSDNVHPTVFGAKALYARFLIDVPEIL